MRIRPSRIIFAFLFFGIASAACGITWDETVAVDPVSGESVTVMTWGSYGGHVYYSPSRYDGVYFPYTEPEWIWFSPHSGYTAFGDSWHTLEDEEIDRVREYLATHYDPSEGQPDLRRKLELLCGVQAIREQHWTGQMVFYRAVAAFYGGNASDLSASDHQLALEYRSKALPLLERWARYLSPSPDKIQHYYLAGDYSRQLGDGIAARVYFDRARTLEWTDETGAAVTGHPYIAALVDEREAQLDDDSMGSAVTRDDRVILSAALGRDDLEKLLWLDPDLSRTTSNGRNALLWSGWAGNTEAVRLLLSAGADIDARAADQSTALILAASEANAGSVRALVEAGANVDLQDIGGMTALMFAGLRNNPEIASVLLDAGADSQLVSLEGGSAMMYADLWGEGNRVSPLLESLQAE